MGRSKDDLRPGREDNDVFISTPFITIQTEIRSLPEIS